MNALAPIADFYIALDAPERHRFTLDDVIAMREIGVIHPDARVELLDGEIIDRASEGKLHAGFAIMLNMALARAVSVADVVTPGTRLSVAQ